jgi:hypothetical protein
MATNDYLPFATGGGANVINQATYVAAAYVPTGRGSGILPSNVYNKIARQASMAAAAIGQLIVNILGINATDDGNLAALTTNLQNAILNAAWSTGDVKPTIKTVADTGWVMMADGTIGDASSGASELADPSAQALFTLLWNNIADTYAPVTGGRDGSAAADWANHKKIQVGTILGRALGSAGAGSGLTVRALGATVGEETHLLTTAEMPAHTHSATFDSGVAGATGSSSHLATGGQTGSTGGGTAHNNMQPTTFINFMIKL